VAVWRIRSALPAFVMEKRMPTYQYRCGSCGKIFERVNVKEELSSPSVAVS
jgi:predicted nucleic acid-binding Zn ribbon protein